MATNSWQTVARLLQGESPLDNQKIVSFVCSEMKSPKRYCPGDVIALPGPAYETAAGRLPELQQQASNANLLIIVAHPGCGEPSRRSAATAPSINLAPCINTVKNICWWPGLRERIVHGDLAICIAHVDTGNSESRSRQLAIRMAGRSDGRRNRFTRRLVYCPLPTLAAIESVLSTPVGTKAPVVLSEARALCTHAATAAQ